jgi:Fe-S-cluster containining protein
VIHCVSFYFFQSLYIFNDKIIRSLSFEKIVWNFIKFDLFVIDGGCKHSGYCCQHLMIQDKGQAVDTTHAFSELQKKEPSFDRFYVNEIEGDRIKYYGCASLSESMTCLEYDTRPSLCRQYPYSMFLDVDKIRKGCGYFVRRRSWRPRWVYSKLKTKVYIVEYNN